MIAASPRALARTSLAALAALLLTGCPAVYPELNTSTRKALAGAVLEPPPPENLRWLKFKGGHVPEKTRDGRTWDQVLGSLPDPYAKLFINGEELLRTPVQTDTLEPTWANGPKGNFKLEPNDKLRVELWDSNPINDHPIGVREIGKVTEDAKRQGEIRIELEGGGDLTLAVEPAHPVIGFGLWYELRTDSCFITRMLIESPAERAGVLKGDEVVKLAGHVVKAMSPDEVRSNWNAVPMGGLPLMLKHPSGTTQNVTLKEGPIYPLFKEYGELE